MSLASETAFIHRSFDLYAESKGITVADREYLQRVAWDSLDRIGYDKTREVKAIVKAWLDERGLESYLYDVRNGVAGARFTCRASREARKLGLAGYRSQFGEIKLTEKGWVEMHRIEAKYTK